MSAATRHSSGCSVITVSMRSFWNAAILRPRWSCRRISGPRTALGCSRTASVLFVKSLMRNGSGIVTTNVFAFLTGTPSGRTFTCRNSMCTSSIGAWTPLITRSGCSRSSSFISSRARNSFRSTPRTSRECGNNC